LQNQIIRGLNSSAVTIFRMTEVVDAGPILKQQALDLRGELDQIFSRIIASGVKMTREILAGQYRLTPQSEVGSSTYARRSVSESEITPSEIANETAEFLYNKIRMLQHPYPNAFLRAGDGKKVFLTRAHLESTPD
jgi:methionyl-tRNA formyltransferase